MWMKCQRLFIDTWWRGVGRAFPLLYRYSRFSSSLLLFRAFSCTHSEIQANLMKFESTKQYEDLHKQLSLKHLASGSISCLIQSSDRLCSWRMCHLLCTMTVQSAPIVNKPTHLEYFQKADNVTVSRSSQLQFQYYCFIHVTLEITFYNHVQCSAFGLFISLLKQHRYAWLT